MILDKLQLLSDGKPNNGALALFGININDARFNLRMARFRGVDKNEFIDNQKVKGIEAEITAKDAKVRTFVIPTNEELMIARETVNAQEAE